MNRLSWTSKLDCDVNIWLDMLNVKIISSFHYNKKWFWFHSTEIPPKATAESHIILGRAHAYWNGCFSGGDICEL